MAVLKAKHISQHEVEVLSRTFVGKWEKVLFNTSPSDKKSAEEHLREVYRRTRLATDVEFIWADSPRDALRQVIYLPAVSPSGYIMNSIHKKLESAGTTISSRRARFDPLGTRQLARFMERASNYEATLETYQQQLAHSIDESNLDDRVRFARRFALWGWLNREFPQAVFQSVLNPNAYDPKLLRLVEDLVDVRREAEVARAEESYALLIANPAEVHFDANGRLHRANGAAVVWRDKSELFAWRGRPVSQFLVLHPERISIASIAAEENVEIRRIMIERYEEVRSPGAYMLDAGAKLHHKDDFGELYVMAEGRPNGWRPWQQNARWMVKVTNATAEWDAATETKFFRTFWLRVDPDMRPMTILRDEDGFIVGKQFGEPQERTAHNAVASTWGLRGEEYHPDLEA